MYVYMKLVWVLISGCHTEGGSNPPAFYLELHITTSLEDLNFKISCLTYLRCFSLINKYYANFNQ